jgi:HlyD family secretion protein
MKHHRKISYWAGSAAILIILAVGCNRPQTDEAIGVDTAEVQNHLLNADVTLSGVLLPAQSVNIASRISGQIQTVAADVGDRVQQGEVLIVLDTNLLRPQLIQAQAALTSAQAVALAVQSRVDQAKINLDTIRKNYDRTKALFDSGVATQSQLDDLKSRLDMAVKQHNSAAGPEYDQARATIDTTKANIQYLQAQIDCTTIRNPINGIVTNRSAEPGEIVSPGATLMTVADTATLKMKTFVSQDLLPYMTIGQEIDVMIDIYPDRAVKGAISGLGPIAVNTGGIFPVEIAIHNDGSILSGLSAHALLHLIGKKGVVIPMKALLESGNRSTVFVIRDGVTQRREITTGLRNDEEIEVLKGLAAGETVAVSNIRVLTDRMPVVVRN